MTCQAMPGSGRRGGWRFQVACVPHVFPPFLSRFLERLENEPLEFMPYSLEEIPPGTGQGIVDGAANAQGEDAGSYVLRIPLPGISVDDLEVAAKDTGLLIETKDTVDGSDGKKKISGKDAKKLVSIAEFIWNKPRVNMRIPLPEEIDPDSVRAVLKHGILTVTLQKRPPRKIDIKDKV